MLDQQFTSEGIHREHSPDYHRMVTRTLKSMIDSTLVEDTRMIEFYQKIERALAWFIAPDGNFANFGDSDTRNARLKPATAKQIWLTKEMQYVVTDGQIGTHLPSDQAIFNEGGFAIIRTPSPLSPDCPSFDSYLAQIACFHSRTHKHADDLSFIWHEYGQPLLIDAGRYGYIGRVEQGSELWHDGHWYSDPMRIFVESTRAHNTLEFNSKNNKRRGASAYGSAINRYAKFPNDIYIIETEIKSHGSIRHARVLLFSPSRWLLVFDWFHDNLGEKHSVRQWWHFSPGLTVRSASHEVELCHPSFPAQLKCSVLTNACSWEPAIIGQMEPDIQGWWSPRERTIEPAAAIAVLMEQQTSGTIATLFTFSKASPSQTSARIPPSGRRALFQWTDDSGRHKLEFERPVSGELAMRYKLTPALQRPL